MNSGAITAWMLVRSVIPAGKSAGCDYLSISLYPGAPPKPLGLDGVEVAVKKAGLTMSAQEFVDHRSSQACRELGEAIALTEWDADTVAFLYPKS